MNAQPRLPQVPAGLVLPLDALRIERALARRQRYKYVHPRVVSEGGGWKIVSPNCSRNVHPEGGEIDIAWLLPAGQADWQLHARDHAQGCWRLRRQSPLHELLALLCADPAREFWR
ncbi:MAG TPA: hypothetical protein VK195_04735 [Burkholderiaceae bacterium]|nr:hypothetical protein [Burkholderiaceae bacterium]